MLADLLALPASWSLSTTFLVSFGAALLLKTALDKVFDPSRHRSSRTMASATSLLSNKDTLNTDTNATIRSYESMYAGARSDIGANTQKEAVAKREKEYATMVNSFYDLVTDFYEYGWGDSFHFAPRFVNETFIESIYRAEHFLGMKLGAGKGMKVLDVGCGVGGPMRNIARFSGADVTGVTINEYQVKVGNRYCAEQGLADTCRSQQGDFQKLDEKFAEGSFDAAYEIEATCHSPDRVQTFGQVAHCLKKGALFTGYEWVVLPAYDADDLSHVRVKEGIEVGNGLPTLATGQDIKDALEAAGFEVLEAYDANSGVHAAQQIPWYASLDGSWTSMSGFRMTTLGRTLTHAMVTFLETIRIAPKGSVRVSALLNATALDLVEGGKKELFTPSYFFLAKKL